MSTTTSTPHATALTGELDLLRAVFEQAMRDLAASAPPRVQHAARLFWLNHDGMLASLCELAGLDWREVQRRMCRRYPVILEPAQLDLALGGVQ